MTNVTTTASASHLLESLAQWRSNCVMLEVIAPSGTGPNKVFAVLLKLFNTVSMDGTLCPFHTSHWVMLAMMSATTVMAKPCWCWLLLLSLMMF
jgi:hypothetical protein